MSKSSAECVDLVCDQVSWIEIATEQYDANQTDLYQYKMKWDYNNSSQDYNCYVIFELGTQYNEYPIQNANDYANITFIDSNISEISANDEYYWYRACTTGYEPQHGDSCWYDMYHYGET